MAGGRPTKYNPGLHPIIGKALARLGYTDQEIADQLSIEKSTLELWKKKHKEFSDSIKKGKVEIINQIEHSLYKRAIGYDTKEIDAIQTADGKIVPQKVRIKHIPGDATAIIFSLINLTRNNKEGMKWEHVNKQEVSIKTEDGQSVEIRIKNTDERRAQILETLESVKGISEKKN